MLIIRFVCYFYCVLVIEKAGFDRNETIQILNAKKNLKLSLLTFIRLFLLRICRGHFILWKTFVTSSSSSSFSRSFSTSAI
jgi:hypothetical protein